MLWQHLITGSGSVFGMRIQIQEHGNRPESTNKPGFLPFKKGFVPSHVCFWPISFFKYIFHVKIQLFVTLESDQDPDLHISEFTNKPGFLPFKKAFYLRRHVFWPISFFKYIFHVKIQLFVTESDQDPDLHISELTNKPGFLPFKKAFYLRRHVFWPISSFKYIFHVKIQLFVTLKSDQDPNLDQN